MNLVEVMEKFSTDAACRVHLEKVRWPDGVTCPKCGHDRIVRLTTRKQFTCAKRSCRYRFSVTTGTIMHASKISLPKWMLAITLLSDAKKSMSSLQLHRHLHVSKECCWHMAMRIREAMADDPAQAALFSGLVQADDYYFGGTPRHRPGVRKPPGRSLSKQPIVGVYEENSGRIRTSVVPDASAPSLMQAMERWIDFKNTTLHTDKWTSYLPVGRRCRAHGRADHARKEYVTPDGVHCNSVENAWSLFARAVMGSFHKISVKHLPRYLAEFDSRFNARHENGSYFDRILRQANGRRLPMSVLVNR